MHEMSIVTSVLDTAHEEAAKHAGARVTKIGLRIGEWSGVDRESLQFCFDSMVASDPNPPVLEIQYLPRQNLCGRCGELFQVKDFDIACPGCGFSPTEPVSGNEMDIAYLELEE
ncbi:MAG: hydrogenase maturation nickel metallochaperone HypA [Acidobacteriia bacterium]|nr:hydrogenase maturation nickel metallochaperone HypA [Terriglobia bacterium]